MRTLENIFGRDGIEHWRNDVRVCDQFNCGFPHFSLNRAVLLSNYNELNTMQPTAFNIIRVQQISPSQVVIEFSLLLRTLTHISIKPSDEMTVNVDETSLFVREVIQDQQRHFLSRIMLGRKMNEPIRHTVVLQVTIFNF